MSRKHRSLPPPDPNHDFTDPGVAVPDAERGPGRRVFGVDECHADRSERRAAVSRGLRPGCHRGIGLPQGYMQKVRKGQATMFDGIKPKHSVGARDRLDMEQLLRKAWLVGNPGGFVCLFLGCVD